LLRHLGDLGNQHYKAGDFSDYLRSQITKLVIQRVYQLDQSWLKESTQALLLLTDLEDDLLDPCQRLEPHVPVVFYR
jgi:hypothetical protein